MLWTIDNGIFGQNHVVTLVEADAAFGEWVETALVPWRTKMGYMGVPIVVASARDYQLHNGAVAVSGDSYERRQSESCVHADRFPWRLAACPHEGCRHPSLADSRWCWEHQPSKRKCARAGCSNNILDDSDFCLSCLVERRDSPSTTCDNLAAVE